MLNKFKNRQARIIFSLLCQILIGLWLFKILPIGVPAFLDIHDFPVASGSNPAIEKTIFYIFFIIIFPGILHWIELIIILKNRFFKNLLLTLSSFMKSKRGRKSCLVLLADILVTLYIAFFTAIPPNSFFLHVSFSIIVGVILIFFKPPVSIVLTCSNKLGINIAEENSRLVYPFRSIALLDRKIMGSAIIFGKDDNFRTIGGDFWQDIVHKFCHNVDYILVDTRTPSKSVREEIEFIFEEKLTTKTIFIVNDDETCPALSQVISDFQSLSLNFCTMTDFQNKKTNSENKKLKKLIQMLGNKNDDIYWPVIEELSKMGENAAFKCTGILLKKGKNWIQKKNAAIVLGKMTGDIDLSVLITTLKDKNRNVRQGAVWAIGNQKMVEAVPQLQQLFFQTNTSWVTKKKIIYALMNLNTEESKKTLEAIKEYLTSAKRKLKYGENSGDLNVLFQYVAERFFLVEGLRLNYDDLTIHMTHFIQDLIDVINRDSLY